MTVAPTDEDAVLDGTEATTLVALTDEELAVLGAADGFGVLPIWADLSEPERTMGARTAFRGLIARGLVEMPSRDALADYEVGGPDADLRIDLREDVSALLALRQGAPVVLAVARTAALGQDFLYAHVVDDAALAEEVAGEGIHQFALMGSANLAAWLGNAALHPEAADGVGESYAVSAGQEPPDALVAALGEGHLRSDVVLRRRADAHFPLVGFFSGPQGTWVIRSESGLGEAVTAEPTTVENARRALADLAAQACAAAVVGEDGA